MSFCDFKEIETRMSDLPSHSGDFSLPPTAPPVSSATTSGPPPTVLRPGNYDRAWNDPPELSSAAQSGTAIHKLNKRIGFPVSQSGSVAQPINKQEIEQEKVICTYEP